MGYFVIDASALVVLERHCGDSCAYQKLISEMTNLAQAGELSCPPLATEYASSSDDRGFMTSWVKLAAAHYKFYSPDYMHLDSVLDLCPGLLDPDDPDESPQVEALALALHVEAALGPASVSLVTDQWIDPPLTDAQGPAAGQLGMKAITVPEFVHSLIGS